MYDIVPGLRGDKSPPIANNPPSPAVNAANPAALSEKTTREAEVPGVEP